LVATTLHQLSDRAEQPFIAVNCGAIAENLIESELFGHERRLHGSVAHASRMFERASGDIVPRRDLEMPIDMQVRLLRP
jgi:DNA-binding NtrC family response regulator